MHIINSISEFHRLLSLPEPVHPLVSVIRITDMVPAENSVWEKFLVNFYSVSLKRDVSIKLKYGQQHYDFDKGIMSFTAPKQVQSVAASEMDKFRNDCGSGYMLIFHPVFSRMPYTKHCTFRSARKKISLRYSNGLNPIINLLTGIHKISFFPRLIYY